MISDRFRRQFAYYSPFACKFQLLFRAVRERRRSSRSARALENRWILVARSATREKLDRACRKDYSRTTNWKLRRATPTNLFFLAALSLPYLYTVSSRRCESRFNVFRFTSSERNYVYGLASAIFNFGEQGRRAYVETSVHFATIALQQL